MARRSAGLLLHRGAGPAREVPGADGPIKSNEFEMEWPPRSGRRRSFPEVDRAGWFTLEQARVKLVAGQLPLLDRLAELRARP